MQWGLSPRAHHPPASRRPMPPWSAPLPNRRSSWQECPGTHCALRAAALHQRLPWQKSLLETGSCHLHGPPATRADGHKPKHAGQQACTFGWSHPRKMSLSYMVSPPLSKRQERTALLRELLPKNYPHVLILGIH